jgi:hypothetical protein
VKGINRGDRIILPQDRDDISAHHDEFRMRHKVPLTARQLKRERTEAIGQFLANPFRVHGLIVGTAVLSTQVIGSNSFHNLLAGSSKAHIEAWSLAPNTIRW